MFHVAVVTGVCPVSQDDQPRASSLQFGPRSTGSVDSPTGPRRRETGIALAATFTANNRWAAAHTHTHTGRTAATCTTAPASHISNLLILP